MATPVEIVREFNQACCQKDFSGFEKLLHPHYTFRGPLMQMTGREEAVTLMKQCPFRFHQENAVLITEGNQVVHIYDWVIEAPIQGTFRMAQHFTVEDGQIRSLEVIYDTSGFPKEVKELVEKMKPEACAV